ncbi:DUF4920 domain-containing protein [Polaribacter sp. Asnod1-A03]|uniref:DUF4920 domain-containing protein n=1 Tax=Polaribacter sp. Asnod1-A03 TaxID=3160581 RepID=UPI0038647730
MKYLVQICLITIIAFTACKEAKKETKEVEKPKQEIAFASFGDKITSEDAITSAQMFDKFKTLELGDTVNVKFASSINDVCSKKGCWMKLPLDKETETMVRFKDYGFFMPLDSKDSEVIVQGKAFVTETSVEDLRHYAADAGKSEEEIAAITESKIEFAFEANGVLMKTK